MKKFSRICLKPNPVEGKRGKFETPTFWANLNKTVASDLNDERLRKHLKRAVNREVAPQSLIDSIKSGVRG